MNLDFQRFEQDMNDFANKSVFNELEKKEIKEFAKNLIEENKRVRDLMGKLPSSIRLKFNEDLGLRNEFLSIIKKRPSVFDEIS